MILSHKHFDLLDKTILERVIFQPPLTFDSTMHDEACFMHIVHGSSRLYSPTNQLDIHPKDNLVMKCGSYLNKWFKNEGGEPNEAILVHLYPDVLKAVYGDQLPEVFFSHQNSSRSSVEKLNPIS